MLPLHTRHKQHSRTIIESDLVSRARRFYAKHSKNRASVAGGIVLTIVLLYFLWPSSKRKPLDFLAPVNGKRPSYTGWPKGRRAEAVKEAFTHAYSSYERSAMPADELRPLRNSSIQNFNGWGVSMYDALDTLWLMDMKLEFERAVNHISKATFHKHPSYDVMFFETVIRYLGGLLSAYALSGREVLLTKADELGKKLLPVFNTPTGMPAFSINPDTGDIDVGPRHGDVVLAEFASCQMEYKYLSQRTGVRPYFTLVDKTMDLMERSQLPNGMWDTTWNITNGLQSDNHLTIGALADSGYEYLLKQYLMSGRSEKRLRNMYLKAVSGIIENLLFISPERQILYVTDVFTAPAAAPPGTPPRPSRKFEHLACFLPGLLALGAHTLQDEMDADARALHAWAAAGLAHSCWLMYADQASGLAPEEVVFERWPGPQERPAGGAAGTMGTAADYRDELWVHAVERWRAGGGKGAPPGVPGTAGGVAKPMPNAKSTEKDYLALNTKYLLRPETIESLYMMWRTTGDEIWRDRGWQIFLAIEANCRRAVGYSSVLGVDRRAPDILLPLDEMPSYALAETWKYLYLMFLDHDPLPMDKFVFNTEAHPLPIFEWSRSEKEAFGIN